MVDKKSPSAQQGDDPREPRLLAGGNPQIAKGYGDDVVQRYIAAMPGCKRPIGERLDALIVAAVPDVRKAMKWNSPFYGAGDEDQGWSVSFHCFTKYVKVTFFQGAALDPPPPETSKYPDVRYLHVTEAGLDEAQFSAWVSQAARLPGERM